MIIAIDGPAGAGKSTLAQHLAQTLDFQLVDTGAIYRSVAWKATENGLDLTDGSSLGALADAMVFSFAWVDGENVVSVDGVVPGQAIRTEEISRAASIVSAHPEVRAALLGIQRRLGRSRSTVIEGRDIGTVVFPDADRKFFVTASSEVRAQRRVSQMSQKGVELDYATTLAEICARDERDRTRAIAPLIPADDAEILDSSGRSLPEMLELILDRVRRADAP